MDVRKPLIAVRQLIHSLVFGLLNKRGGIATEENYREDLAPRLVCFMVYNELGLSEVTDICFVIEASVVLRLVWVFRPVPRNDYYLLSYALVYFLDQFVLYRPFDKIPAIRKYYFRKSLRVKKERVEKLNNILVRFLEAVWDIVVLGEKESLFLKELLHTLNMIRNMRQDFSIVLEWDHLNFFNLMDIAEIINLEFLWFCHNKRELILLNVNKPEKCQNLLSSIILSKHCIINYLICLASINLSPEK